MPIKHLINDPVLEKRALHVVTENERVIQATNALKAGDLKLFGELMYASHQSLKELYEVSGKELDTLVDFCKTYSGLYWCKNDGRRFWRMCHCGDKERHALMILRQRSQIIIPGRLVILHRSLHQRLEGESGRSHSSRRLSKYILVHGPVKILVLVSGTIINITIQVISTETAVPACTP